MLLVFKWWRPSFNHQQIQLEVSSKKKKKKKNYIIKKTRKINWEPCKKVVKTHTKIKKKKKKKSYFISSPFARYKLVSFKQPITPGEANPNHSQPSWRLAKFTKSKHQNEQPFGVLAHHLPFSLGSEATGRQTCRPPMRARQWDEGHRLYLALLPRRQTCFIQIAWFIKRDGVH